ncbi:MAG: type I restriction-modification system subunit M N-terminal domain-containing protein, partial [Acidimicrobiales bacterium]
MARQSRNGEPLGFEDTLWKAADKLRGSMDASEYKHVVLGLVFLKYIDDAFTERRSKLAADLVAEGITGDHAADLLESRDEYTAEGVFWVPQEARWEFLQSKAKQPEIGKLIDSAMDAVEVENPSLRGVLPKNFSRPAQLSALRRNTPGEGCAWSVFGHYNLPTTLWCLGSLSLTPKAS